MLDPDPAAIDDELKPREQASLSCAGVPINMVTNIDNPLIFERSALRAKFSFTPTPGSKPHSTSPVFLHPLISAQRPAGQSCFASHIMNRMVALSRLSTTRTTHACLPSSDLFGGVMEPSSLLSPGNPAANCRWCACPALIGPAGTTAETLSPPSRAAITPHKRPARFICTRFTYTTNFLISKSDEAVHHASSRWSVDPSS